MPIWGVITPTQADLPLFCQHQQMKNHLLPRQGRWPHALRPTWTDRSYNCCFDATPKESYGLSTAMGLSRHQMMTTNNLKTRLLLAPVPPVSPHIALHSHQSPRENGGKLPRIQYSTSISQMPHKSCLCLCGMLFLRSGLEGVSAGAQLRLKCSPPQSSSVLCLGFHPLSWPNIAALNLSSRIARRVTLLGVSRESILVL